MKPNAQCRHLAAREHKKLKASKFQLCVLCARLCLTLLFASAPQTFAQGGIPLWTNRYDGPVVTASASEPAMAVDSSGNVFVTGSFWNGNNNLDYVTLKYSSAGVVLWTNRYDGPLGYGSELAKAVAIDSSGNVFVTGTSHGNDITFDYATIKYSSAGVGLWTNRYSGPGNGLDAAHAMAVDSSGNVFVTGYATGSGGTNELTTIAYSNTGVALWTNRFGPAPSYDPQAAAAVDSSGNVVVTGGLLVGSGTSFDYATVSYSSAGVALWTNLYNGPGNDLDQVRAVAVDSSGNVFVTGYSLDSGGNPDWATIKYSSAGVGLWTNRYDGLGNDYAYATAVDGSGNVFVTGSSVGSGGYPDYSTIKYSSAGVALWTNRYNGPANGEDYAYAVAVDSGGNVFVTGTSLGNSSYFDFATVAYSSAGMALWTNRYSGPTTNSFDSASAVAVDSSGNVFVTGYGAGDFVTIKYSSSLPPRLSIDRDGSGGLYIRHTGVPDFTYRLQRAASLIGPWADLVTNSAPASGLIEYHETFPPPTQAFYRMAWP